jgi:hypothetical protein
MQFFLFSYLFSYIYLINSSYHVCFCTQQDNNTVVISFTHATKKDKYLVTKNETLLTMEQIIAICQGGLICGSNYEIY